MDTCRFQTQAFVCIASLIKWLQINKQNMLGLVSVKIKSNIKRHQCDNIFLVMTFPDTAPVSLNANILLGVYICQLSVPLIAL